MRAVHLAGEKQEDSPNPEKESDEESSIDSSSSDEEGYDPWDSLVNATFKECDHLFEKKMEQMKEIRKSESDARRETYEVLRPQYRKAMMAILQKRVLWFLSLQQDPVYKAIKATAREAREEDEFERQEAFLFALNKRRFLLDKVLKRYNPPGYEEDGEEEEESDAVTSSPPPTKQAKIDS